MAKKSTERLLSINDRVCLEVSRELDIPIKMVKDVINNGQSKFTAYTMASNTFDGVRWPYFGAFKAKHKVVQVLSYMKGLTPEQQAFFKDIRNTKRFERRKAKKAETARRLKLEQERLKLNKPE